MWVVWLDAACTQMSPARLGPVAGEYLGTSSPAASRSTAELSAGTSTMLPAGTLGNRLRVNPMNTHSEFFRCAWTEQDDTASYAHSPDGLHDEVIQPHPPADKR